MMTEFLTRLRFLIFRKKRGELDDELRFHLEQSIAAKEAAGLTAAEARRQALIEFGGLERTREQCEEQRPGWWIDSVLRDARYALRAFGRNPLFTVAVLATLTFAIGATTAVFSVMNVLFLRSLPVADPDRLVYLRTSNPPRGTGTIDSNQTFSYSVYDALRRQSGALFTGDGLRAAGG